MITVIKKQGKRICAWQLGSGSAMEAELIREGMIVRRGDTYEIFSRECGSETGQIVRAGDYFKIDEGGKPYPNERTWFEKHHRPLGGDEYEQIPVPLMAWEAGDPDDAPVRTLIGEGRLTISEEDPEHYFQADLWGTHLAAPKDAVLVIYDFDEREFNFVAREIFNNTYEIVQPA